MCDFVYFKDLPNDIKQHIINIKHREYQDEVKEVLSIFEEGIKKNWYKYCKCVDCTSKRGRLYFVEGYFETF